MKALHRRIGAGEIREAADGVKWWNGLTEGERHSWLNLAGSARPVDAYREYLRREVFRGYSD